MQAQAQKQDLQTTLDELETLHRDEAEALRRLSRERLDELTDRKLQLWERLRSLSTEQPLGPEHAPSLARIKRAALHNQMLLHHARDAVLNVLHGASGLTLPAVNNRTAAIPGGLRVDFRG